MNGSHGFLAQVLLWAVPIVVAIILHEVMHGVVARMLGDDTAARAGRLTLNPLAHIDPFGTIILPGLLLFAHAPVFGYAKPVPVDFRPAASAPRRHDCGSGCRSADQSNARGCQRAHLSRD